MADPFFGGTFFGGGFFAELVRAGGTSKRDKKKKRKVIRFSDLTEREKQEELQALALQVRQAPIREVYDLTDDEDDELLLKVLALVMH